MNPKQYAKQRWDKKVGNKLLCMLDDKSKNDLFEKMVGKYIDIALNYQKEEFESEIMFIFNDLSELQATCYNGKEWQKDVRKILKKVNKLLKRFEVK
jgi:hypothetical protein